MDKNIQCGGFTFLNNFDSANLAKVEKVENNKADDGIGENNKSHKNVSSSEFPNDEFNLWTKHDCHGTEFQNNNRTWFYFGIKAATPGVYVKLNLVNLNKQLKMFSQGMSPVFKVIPGHPQWERIKERPTFTGDDKSNEFILSFCYRTSDNSNAVTYFAFTYPFSYTDLQNYLRKIDNKMKNRTGCFADDIYYQRECAIKSLEGRRLDVLTITSYNNILLEREAKIKGLFPERHEKRPFKFHDKKVVFLSARVHPGETPSSFVLNGFLNFILNREDQIAMTLRRLYVFKLIPMLNPDGVAQGYYRMDTRGVNLNRLYLNPSKKDHPTIFAARTLLRYYHFKYNLPDEILDVKNNATSISDTPEEANKTLDTVNTVSLKENNTCTEQENLIPNQDTTKEISLVINKESLENQKTFTETVKKDSKNPIDSGIFLYIDFHGHASKKGIFMYGNHFDGREEASACMLLPKLMSLNNSNFHFTSCNFAEKNMYLVDKRDGMSREGSGRVAVYKLTGLIYSYTLECNYNTGRLVNTVPPRLREGAHKINNQLFIPPKYSPSIFEEVGAALGPSILDMTGNNPNSRIPNSHYRSLKGLQAYLKLISATNMQPPLNKPLNKNSSGDQFDILEDPTGHDIIKLSKFSKGSTIDSTTKNKINFTNNSCDVLCNANIYGTIRKIKNSKKHCHVINRNTQKLPNGNISNNRETKVIASKIISTHVQSNCNLVTSPHKQSKANSKPKFSTKNKITNTLKTIEQKSSAKYSPKKSTVCAKRTVIKKQGSKKLKTISLSKVRQQFHKELGEPSIDNVMNLVIPLHDKKNSKNNVIVNKKYEPTKLKTKF